MHTMRNQVEFSIMWIPFLGCWNEKWKENVAHAAFFAYVSVRFSHHHENLLFCFSAHLTRSRLLRLLETCHSFFFLYFSFINLLFIILSQSDSTYLRLEFTCHNKLSTRSHIAWESSFSCVYFFFLLFFSLSILSVITQHLFDWKWKTSVRKKERKRIADAVFASMSSFW